MQIGQTVYIRIAGGRIGDPYKIKEGIIESIGRKYFVVDGRKFNLDDMRDVTRYSPNSKVYINIQDIYDEDELGKLYDSIRKCFDYFTRKNLTLDQLRRIKSIINEK